MGILEPIRRINIGRPEAAVEKPNLPNMESTTGTATRDQANMESLVQALECGIPENLELDLFNTEHAFSYKNDQALRKALWLFGLMNRPQLVRLGSILGLNAVQLGLPFAEKIIRNTIFEQFCGGTSLQDTLPTIKRLSAAGVFSILDYGAEGKETEADFDHTMEQTIAALKFGAGNPSVPMVSTKITGMARFGLLEAVHRGDVLSNAEKAEFERASGRIARVCEVAASSGVAISFDAEETWIQRPIDDLARTMMEHFNREKVLVYNTYQLYLRDRLQDLRDAHAAAREKGYLLGAKLVRGAYIEKEHHRAETMGYPSPIQADKAATDHDYNQALRYCVEHIEEIACFNASHNAFSAMLLATLAVRYNLPRNHPHLFFAQLFGMSDNLTFNLAKSGFNAGKYVIYGAVKDVMPYLIRRAKENTAVSGDMGREYRFIAAEIKRRRQQK